MIFVGLFAAFGVSLGSFLLLISLTTPHAGSGVIALFFLTFFLAVACFAALVGMLFPRVFHRQNDPDAQKISGGHFRRGLLLGAFATVLLGLETLNMLTPELSVLVLAPFAFIEAYAVRTSIPS